MKAARKHTAAPAANIVKIAADGNEIFLSVEDELGAIETALMQIRSVALAACDGQSDENGLMHLCGVIRDISHSALGETDTLRKALALGER